MRLCHSLAPLLLLLPPSGATLVPVEDSSVAVVSLKTNHRPGTGDHHESDLFVVTRWGLAEPNGPPQSDGLVNATWMDTQVNRLEVFSHSTVYSFRKRQELGVYSLILSIIKEQRIGITSMPWASLKGW